MESGNYSRLFCSVSVCVFLFIVGIDHRCQNGSRKPPARFDDMRDISFAGMRVRILEIFARMLDMLFEVIISSICYSLQLSPSSWEFIFYIKGSLAIKGEFFLVMFPKFQFILFDADFIYPSFFACFHPFLEGFESDFLVVFYEIFDFHLVEFSYSKHEVSRSYLVPEGLSYLCDTKGNSDSHGIQYIFEVDENPLRGFGSQVDIGSFALYHALLSFEHQIEFFGIGPITSSAFRAFYLFRVDEIHHVFCGSFFSGSVFWQLSFLCLIFMKVFFD